MSFLVFNFLSNLLKEGDGQGGRRETRQDEEDYGKRDALSPPLSHFS